MSNLRDLNVRLWRKEFDVEVPVPPIYMSLSNTSKYLSCKSIQLGLYLTNAMYWIHLSLPHRRHYTSDERATDVRKLYAKLVC